MPQRVSTKYITVKFIKSFSDMPNWDPREPNIDILGINVMGQGYKIK